jgi:hypothetical protein
MAYVGLIFVIVAAWLVWVPVQERRRAAATGREELTFSRMLLRIIVAFCVLGIGGMLLFSARILAGRGPLFEIFYWLGVLTLAFVMFMAGVTEYLFVKRDLLMGRKRLIRELTRRGESGERAE